jgi:hypothetical protein
MIHTSGQLNPQVILAYSLVTQCNYGTSLLLIKIFFSFLWMKVIIVYSSYLNMTECCLSDVIRYL